MEKAKKSSTGKTPSTAAAAKSVPQAHGVGRRKCSIARVWLRKGKGTITVNGKDYQTYFDTNATRLEVSTLARLIPESLKFDVDANVYGGGLSGQADAVKLGIARALVSIDEALRITLRKFKLLTVDARIKERKKYGQKGARRKFQFVKR